MQIILNEIQIAVFLARQAEWLNLAMTHILWQAEHLLTAFFPETVVHCCIFLSTCFPLLIPAQRVHPSGFCHSPHLTPFVHLPFIYQSGWIFLPESILSLTIMPVVLVCFHLNPSFSAVFQRRPPIRVHHMQLQTHLHHSKFGCKWDVSIKN